MEDNKLSEDLENKTSSIDSSRRRFTKSGLTASGVILTLASRPVLANLGVCKSPSGFLSGNVSAQGDPLYCDGRSPEYWMNNPKSWTAAAGYEPGEYRPPTGSSQNVNRLNGWVGGTKFSEVFGSSHYDTGSVEYSLMQVLWMQDQDPYQIGGHCVAAVLNAAAGFTPPSALDEASVINMFMEWETTGIFHPTAGVDWGPTEIVYYIQSTFSG